MARVARDIMSPNPDCIGENETLLDAAKKMAERGYGAMPIVGEDNRLKGMLTDRDIVVKALAHGKDPASTRVGELGEGKPVTVGADDSLEEALQTMAQHKVRRLPVIDGHDLVGIVSVADVARALEDDWAKGDLIEAISEGPPQVAWVGDPVFTGPAPTSDTYAGDSRLPGDDDDDGGDGGGIIVECRADGCGYLNQLLYYPSGEMPICQNPRLARHQLQPKG